MFRDGSNLGIYAAGFLHCMATPDSPKSCASAVKGRELFIFHPLGQPETALEHVELRNGKWAEADIIGSTQVELGLEREFTSNSFASHRTLWRTMGMQQQKVSKPAPATWQKVSGAL